MTVHDAPPDGGRFLTKLTVIATLGGLLFVIHDPHVWRTMLAVAAVQAIALLVGMLALPDSLRWYALVGRLPEARKVLSLRRTPDAGRTSSMTERTLV